MARTSRCGNECWEFQAVDQPIGSASSLPYTSIDASALNSSLGFSVGVGKTYEIRADLCQAATG